MPGFGPPQLYGAAPYGAPPHAAQPYEAQPYVSPYGGWPPTGPPAYPFPSYGVPAYGAGWGPGQAGPDGAPWGWVPTATRRSGLALASMLCAIFGILTYGVGFPVAIILGHMARHQLRREPRPGAGLARAGLIIGYIGLALTVALIVLVVLHNNGGSSGSGGNTSNQNVLFLH